MSSRIGKQLEKKNLSINSTIIQKPIFLHAQQNTNKQLLDHVHLQDTIAMDEKNTDMSCEQKSPSRRTKKQKQVSSNWLTEAESN